MTAPDTISTTPIVGCPHDPPCDHFCMVANATDDELRSALDIIGDPLPGTVGETGKMYAEAEVNRRGATRRPRIAAPAVREPTEQDKCRAWGCNGCGACVPGYIPR